MTLVPGTRLGPYEVTAAIGAGGMGEVYRATDTNLKRPVAIKVLPASVAGEHDRLARFQREAEVLAALNHPHIAAIYGLEKTASVTALVMEFIDGEDLSERIGRGAIPIDDAMPIARQIAEALEAAHEQGIIHRDLKPANIKVRPDGSVKVLDFGLAKAAEQGLAIDQRPGGDSITTPAMTMHGMILGTAAYMAPEQAKGKPVDRRADVWAFGAVLYEMLSGRRAFTGEDATDTIVAVVSKEPDWSLLPVDTPPTIRKLLRRCLEKDRKRRLDSAGAARMEIEEVLAGSPIGEGGSTSATPPPRRAFSRGLAWAAAALSVALAIAVWAPWRTDVPASPDLTLTPLSFEQGGQTAAVWSPDGKAVAFAARQLDTDPYQVYVRYLDSPVATRLTQLAEGVTGIVQWTTTSQIVFQLGTATGLLWSVSPVGGDPEPWAGGSSGDQALTLLSEAPAVARDGSVEARLLVSSAGALPGTVDQVAGLWIESPPGSPRRPYTPAPFASRLIGNTPTVQFSPDGRQILLMQNAGEGEVAWLMPYPPSEANPPRRILQGLSRFSTTPKFSWMPDNRHIVLSGSPTEAPPQLYLADTVSGTLKKFSSGTRPQVSPVVSPDGSKLAFLESETDFDIISVDLATAVVTSVMATQRAESMPAWAARASTLVYITSRNGAQEIWLRTPGQADRPLVTPRDFPPDTTRGFRAPVLSPDGTRVIYRRSARGGGDYLWISAVAGGPPLGLVKDPTTVDFGGSWSPDGNWFVYSSNVEGSLLLKKLRTAGQSEPEVLKADVRPLGTWVPLWSPSGEWVLYDDGGATLISPDGSTTRRLSTSRAVAYAFSADGQTIYGIRPGASSRDRIDLFSIGVTTGIETTIGSLAREHLPANPHLPTLRLSLTPDGRSITYSVARRTANLWLMDGLASIPLR